VFAVKGCGESGRCRVVVDAGRVDDAADDGREALDDVRVIAEARHATSLAHEAPPNGSGRPVVAPIRVSR
jgi:hypothetical protein